MKKGHLLLIIVFLIIVIGCIGFYLRKPNTEAPIVEPPLGGPIEKVTDRDNYYMVENCVNKFYSYYEAIFENKNPEEEDVKKTYNLLDKQYISFKNITQENLATILLPINESVVNIYDMYVSNQNEYMSVYIVNGILRETISKELTNFTIMIKIDKQNGTFSVLLQDYIKERYKDLNIGSNLTTELVNNIEENRNNTYVFEEITDKIYMLDLFARYKEEVLYNTDLAYENLDQEYKVAKFGTLKKFKEYAEDNKNRHSTMELEQFKVSEEEGYKQYIGIDKDGYYYIFRETELMKYKLILDTYTIDLPEFLEQYSSASTVDRVGYNIQKVLDAINTKDYEYIYNKLDFEFKAVNYVTLESFEKAIKDNLFERNEVKEVSSFNEGATYVFKLIITDVKDNEKEQPMTVIMQLGEITACNFVAYS